MALLGSRASIFFSFGASAAGQPPVLTKWAGTIIGHPYVPFDNEYLFYGCLGKESTVMELTPRILSTTFSSCSIINTYSMAFLGLEPEVVNL